MRLFSVLVGLPTLPDFASLASEGECLLPMVSKNIAN